MTLVGVSTAIALAGTIILGIVIIARLVFSKQTLSKEGRLALAKNWSKMQYLSYLLVAFFVLCGMFLIVVLGMDLAGSQMGALQEVWELILVTLLLVSGVIIAMLSLSILRGEKR